MLSIIVARTRNRVIGKDNQVPWRLRNDFIRLKSLILGHVVILGRKTYDSLTGYYDKSGRPMPAKMYIIITRQPAYKPSRKNAMTAPSFTKAIEKAKQLSNEIYIIGGAQIFEQAMPLADRLYITEVNAKIDGDTFFPEINPKVWAEVTREKHHKDTDHNYDYDFVMFDRV